MDIVEFALKFKDMYSSQLHSFGNQTQKTFQQANSFVSKLTEHNKVLGQSYSTIQKRILEVEKTIQNSTIPSQIREAKRELASLQKQAGKHPGNTNSIIEPKKNNVLNSVKQIAMIGGAAELIKETAQIGVRNEQTAVSFQVLLGSAEKATKMIGEMTKYANTTPYEKMDIQNSAKLMLSFGIAQEKVMPTMRMLGDIAMGDKEKLQSMTLAYSQMSSAGKLQGQDLLQMINAGFNPLQEISKMSGKSMAQLKKDMEKGKISTDMVQSAFFHATSKGGLFYQMTDKIGQTVGGKFSTLIDTGKEKLLLLYKIVEPLIIPTMETLSAILDALETPLQWIVNGVNWLVTGFKEANPIVLGATILIGSLTAGIAAYNIVQFLASEKTREWVVSQLALSRAMFTSPVTWIVFGIVALIAVIGFLIYKIDGWGKTWHNLIEFLKLGTNSFVTFFQLQWLYFKNDFMTGLELIEKGWYKLKGLWDKEGANAGLAALEKNRNDRAAEIAASQGKLSQLTKQMGDMKVWELKWNDKKPGDIVKGIKKGLGLSPSSNTGLLGNNTALGQGNATSGAANEKAITSGGPKVINITVQKFLDNIHINSQTLTEGTTEVEQKILEMFARVLAQGATTA